MKKTSFNADFSKSEVNFGRRLLIKYGQIKVFLYLYLPIVCNLFCTFSQRQSFQDIVNTKQIYWITLQILISETSVSRNRLRCYNWDNIISSFNFSKTQRNSQMIDKSSVIVKVNQTKLSCKRNRQMHFSPSICFLQVK